MRLVLTVTLATVICCLQLATSSYKGYKTYRLRPSASQSQLLKEYEDVQGFDVWSQGRVANAPTDIMVAPTYQPDFEAFLMRNGIASEVLIPDVQESIDAEKRRQNTVTRSSGESINFQQYYNHPEINAYLDEMAAAYPRIATVEIIGKSTEGRDMKVLKISRGGKNPVIWIDAGIHAREWIAPAMALYVINQLLENPANSALLDGVDWHILPVLNPDGYQWTHTVDRLWRKTRSTTTFIECLGVDANRNFGYHWGEYGADDDPCSELYYGPKAFSEPETAAIRDHLLANAATALYLSFHSYGGYFLYPWGWTTTLADNSQELHELARKANAAQTAAGGSSYTVGATSHGMYTTSGDSLDWTKGVANISLSYIVELPGGGFDGFDLPANEIQKTVSQFFPAVVVFGDHVRDAK